MHLGYPLNTVQYNAVYWISPDNNRILIRGAFMNGAYNGKGVSMCTLTRKWKLERTQCAYILKTTTNMIGVANQALPWHMMANIVAVYDTRTGKL